LDPDLEQPDQAGATVDLGVADAAAGTHHLYLSGLGAADVAQRILVGDGAVAHIGDDLHVAVAVQREAGAGLDGVVVPHPQRAHPHALGIDVVGEAEMVVGIEPAAVEAVELFEWAKLQHGGVLLSVALGGISVPARPWTIGGEGTRLFP